MPTELGNEIIATVLFLLSIPSFFILLWVGCGFIGYLFGSEVGGFLGIFIGFILGLFWAAYAVIQFVIHATAWAMLVR